MSTEETNNDEERRNWHRLHDRYYATEYVMGEPGMEHFAIDKAIYSGLCVCTGKALYPCRIVQVETTVIPRDADQYGHPRSSIFVTVVAEPMVPPQKEDNKVT